MPCQKIFLAAHHRTRGECQALSGLDPDNGLTDRNRWSNRLFLCSSNRVPFVIAIPICCSGLYIMRDMTSVLSCFALLCIEFLPGKVATIVILNVNDIE